MNKLSMSTVKITGNLDLLNIESDTIYEFDGEVQIKELKIKANFFHTLWKINENASVTFGNILEIENVSGTLEIESLLNSKFLFQLGLQAKGNNSISIQNTLLKDKAESTIKVRVVGEENSHTVLRTTGILKEHTKENIFLEDVKYLTENSSYIECIPELFVSTSDCQAMHFLTMGDIREEDLFYLNSKGICDESAKKLIRQCFLKSMLIREEE